MAKVKLTGESIQYKVGKVEIELEIDDMLRQLSTQGHVAHSSTGQLIMLKQPAHMPETDDGKRAT